MMDKRLEIVERLKELVARKRGLIALTFHYGNWEWLSLAWGLAGYPVFTHKHHTDLSYLACASALIAQHAVIYPQFATHNAHTLAAVVA